MNIIKQTKFQTAQNLLAANCIGGAVSILKVYWLYIFDLLTHLSQASLLLKRWSFMVTLYTILSEIS